MRRVGLAVFLLLLGAGCLESPSRPDATRVADERAALLEGIYGPETQSIRIVVHAHPGREPTQPTREAVVAPAAALLGKPVELEVRVEESPFGEDHVWTHAETQAHGRNLREEIWPDGVALVHVVAVPGCLEYNQTRPCIAGISGMTAWIMTDAQEGDPVPRDPAWRDVPLVGWYRLERWLYTHELGHVFGLVGTIPQVTDRLWRADCSCHGTDQDSTMYRFRQGLRVPTDDSPMEIIDQVQMDNLHLYTYSDLDLADGQAFRERLAGLGDQG